jgi:hypothetical protein
MLIASFQLSDLHIVANLFHAFWIGTFLNRTPSDLIKKFPDKTCYETPENQQQPNDGCDG